MRAKPKTTREPNPSLAEKLDPMPGKGPNAPIDTSEKITQLEPFRVRPTDETMTTDHGLPIVHTDDSLKAGARGPSLLEDFHLREKITRFDHERIPERVVHARGSGAHGIFQLYAPIPELSKAAVFNDTSAATPVFVRFSTVQGSRGSADTVRDVRGFATKFFTTEGNFDLVGNNMPVFFIQDGIKFPDVIHAVKPEPGNEIPQGASAHDSFWDFISLMPESAHMVMWQMSDRAIPRSYRMMEGFGVHTFRLVNAEGESHLVKFHWKPVLGAHSLVWDEAQKLAGKDPDFHRRDLWNAIEMGAYPEFELGIQVMNEGEDIKYGFDLLDPTKLVPEELVPVRRIGKMTLNRNPQNFFAETEQIAFHLGNLVPGIDVTDDPLLQARLFSYLDTQLTRLGGPNFAEIPINKPIRPVFNHQQDGFHRDSINTGTANYHPNSIGGGCPFLADPKVGFTSLPTSVQGPKVRERSPSFLDHFSQATMFLNSQSPAERRHLVDACRFELGKVTRPYIRERVLGIFREIDPKLAEEVALGIGVKVPSAPTPPPRGTAMPNFRGDNGGVTKSPALSLVNQPRDSIATRKIAFLCEDGFNDEDVSTVKTALEAAGATVEVIASLLGVLTGAKGKELPVNKSFLTAASVFYDALFIPGGSASALGETGDAAQFVNEAFKHDKAIAASGDGIALLADLNAYGAIVATDGSTDVSDDQGVVTAAKANAAFAKAFVAAIGQHRHTERSKKKVPA